MFPKHACGSVREHGGHLAVCWVKVPFEHGSIWVSQNARKVLPHFAPGAHCSQCQAVIPIPVWWTPQVSPSEVTPTTTTKPRMKPPGNYHLAVSCQAQESDAQLVTENVILERPPKLFIYIYNVYIYISIICESTLQYMCILYIYICIYVYTLLCVQLCPVFCWCNPHKSTMTDWARFGCFLLKPSIHVP
jgi:hypothetical protein